MKNNSQRKLEVHEFEFEVLLLQTWWNKIKKTITGNNSKSFQTKKKGFQKKISNSSIRNLESHCFKSVKEKRKYIFGDKSRTGWLFHCNWSIPGEMPGMLSKSNLSDSGML